MVGRDLDELFPHVPHTPGEPILELDGLRVRKSGDGRRTWSLRRGEILGIAGLVGAGRTTPGARHLRARAGRRGPDPGRSTFDGRLRDARERASPRESAS